MEKQKSRSRHAAALETGDWIELKKIEEVRFLGYTALESEVFISGRKWCRRTRNFINWCLTGLPFMQNREVRWATPVYRSRR
jgi:alanyl-tRNA synthetase